MKFYTVSDSYITFLRTFDTRVPYNNTNRPYIGIILQIGEIEYLAPLSSPKPKHDSFKDKNPTIHKLHEKNDTTKKLGIIHINNMIPVISTEIALVDFSTQQPRYRDLLIKQYDFIKANKANIVKKAYILHNAITNKKEPIFSKFNALCCDYSLLENNHINYK